MSERRTVTLLDLRLGLVQLAASEVAQFAKAAHPVFRRTADRLVNEERERRARQRAGA